MPSERLDYQPVPLRADRLRLRRVLAVAALAAPAVTLPSFAVGTLLLQDALIDGDGRSWHRAALWAATPTGLANAVALAGALGVLPGARRPRPTSAVVAAALNGNALALIALGILLA